MTIRALVVPVLINARPMHGIAGVVLIRLVQPEPALPALRLGPGIPRNIEGLQTTITNINQVLLEWVNTKGVFDLPFPGVSAFLHTDNITIVFALDTRPDRAV